MKMFILSILSSLFVVNYAYPHPVHISVITIEYNENMKEFDIMIRLFTDDFEAIINHEHKSSLKLIKENEEKNNPFINIFIKKYFNLKFNNKEVTGNLRISSVQYDKKKNTTELRYKIKHKIPRTVKVKNSIFLNHFYDQKNLFIFTCGKNQETCKFDRKKTEFEFQISNSK